MCIFLNGFRDNSTRILLFCFYVTRWFSSVFVWSRNVFSAIAATLRVNTCIWWGATLKNVCLVTGYEAYLTDTRKYKGTHACILTKIDPRDLTALPGPLHAPNTTLSVHSNVFSFSYTRYGRSIQIAVFIWGEIIVENKASDGLKPLKSEWQMEYFFIPVTETGTSIAEQNC